MIFAAFALLLAALALVVAELLVPSHGVLAIFASLCAIASIVFAYQFNAGLAAIFAVLVVLSAPIAFYFAVKLYPTTVVGRRVILSEPRPQETEAFITESARLAELVGHQGVAITPLRPAGSIEINGRRINAQAAEEMIDAGMPVQVVNVSGMKVIVRSVG